MLVYLKRLSQISCLDKSFCSFEMFGFDSLTDTFRWGRQVQRHFKDKTLSKEQGHFASLPTNQSSLNKSNVFFISRENKGNTKYSCISQYSQASLILIGPELTKIKSNNYHFLYPYDLLLQY